MNKYFSDFLPAVLVKDLRQAFRSHGYVALLLLCALGAWLSAWGNVGAAGEGEDMPGFISLSWYGVLAAFVFVFCIPWRAGSAVKSDTRVKGTNFLMLTPITSRRIVWSVWLSAAVQMGIMLVAFVPMYLFLEHHGEAEIRSLWQMVGAGLVMTAVQMFASRLHPLLRFGVLAYMLKELLGLLLSAQTLAFLIMQQGESHLEISAWQYGGMAALAVLGVVLLLEFTRRYYAPLSENCSVGYRILLPLLFALGAVLSWLGQAHINHEMFTVALERTAAAMIVVAAVADAAMPSCRIPAHDRRCLPWLPKVLQVPGVSSSTLWLGVALVFSFMLHVMPQHGTEDWVAYVQHLAPAEGVCTLSTAYLLLLCLLMADVCCKRESTLRPVLFCVMMAVLSLLGVVILFIVTLNGTVTPVAWVGVLPLPSSPEDAENIAAGYHIVRAVCCAAVFALLLWRGRLKRA